VTCPDDRPAGGPLQNGFQTLVARCRKARFDPLLSFSIAQSSPSKALQLSFATRVNFQLGMSQMQRLTRLLIAGEALGIVPLLERIIMSSTARISLFKQAAANSVYSLHRMDKKDIPVLFMRLCF
jgi:hypothetical protein